MDEKVEVPKGYQRNPLTQEELMQLGGDRAEKVIEVVSVLNKIDDMTKLT